MVGWSDIVWISTSSQTRFLESVNQGDIDLRGEKEAVFLGRCRHGRFQVAYSVRPGARKRTKSAMTDRVVCFLRNQRLAWHSRSRYHKSVDVPVTYLGIAGRQVSLPRMRLRNGGEVRSGFAGSPGPPPRHPSGGPSFACMGLRCRGSEPPTHARKLACARRIYDQLLC